MTAGVLLPNGVLYEHSFSLADLADLEAFLLSHWRTVTLAKVAAGDTSEHVVAVRHDVDHSIAHALRFARWEAERGIHSSYYLLPSADYWRRDFAGTTAVAYTIQQLGHEIGLHNDAMSMVNGEAAEAIDLVRYQAGLLRAAGLEVTGCADHGGQISGTMLWKHGYTPADAGLAYEAYELMRRQPTKYHTDNRGEWSSGPLVDEPGKLSLVSAHPEHWTLP